MRFDGDTSCSNSSDRYDEGATRSSPIQLDLCPSATFTVTTRSAEFCMPLTFAGRATPISRADAPHLGWPLGDPENDSDATIQQRHPRVQVCESHQPHLNHSGSEIESVLYATCVVSEVQGGALLTSMLTVGIFSGFVAGVCRRRLLPIFWFFEHQLGDVFRRRDSVLSERPLEDGPIHAPHIPRRQVAAAGAPVLAAAVRAAPPGVHAGGSGRGVVPLRRSDCGPLQQSRLAAAAMPHVRALERGHRTRD